MERQRRQGELIHHVSFIAVAEVADIFLMRDVGFRNQQAVRPGRIQNGAPEFNDQMRLRQVNTGAVSLFPQKTDRIESDCARAARCVFQQDVDTFQ